MENLKYSTIIGHLRIVLKSGTVIRKEVKCANTISDRGKAFEQVNLTIEEIKHKIEGRLEQKCVNVGNMVLRVSEVAAVDFEQS